MTETKADLENAELYNIGAGLLNKAITTSGYRPLAGSADASLDPKDLRVQDGQLLRRSAGTDVSIDDVDYLVLVFEHRSTLADETFPLVEALPFHAYWRSAIDKIARSGGASDAADTEMMELRSAVLLSPALSEGDRLPLLQVYDAKWEQYEAQFKPELKAGGGDRLLEALRRTVEIDRNVGGGLAPLLGAASAAISDVTAAPRPFAIDQKPDGKELSATFEAMMKVQREHIATATPEQLTETARAYAVAAGRR
jgi:hypothetical protein